jgi:hypothetical protein
VLLDVLVEARDTVESSNNSVNANSFLFLLEIGKK